MGHRARSVGAGFSRSAFARPPSPDTLQVRPCKLGGGIHGAKGPATVGKDRSSWSVCRVFNKRSALSTRRIRSSTKPPANCLVWCPCRLRDRWRHGRCHRAPRDGFTACPASGEGRHRALDRRALAFSHLISSERRDGSKCRPSCFAPKQQLLQPTAKRLPHPTARSSPTRTRHIAAPG
ncbi:hypothetical protein XACM_3262 [Xanthomonas euvesicatoria pv. citrumelo F1]|nr:hypothetical protein XACM_3262 [Xanthomonas euvesicatoria pv. citrumelo F1]